MGRWEFFVVCHVVEMVLRWRIKLSLEGISGAEWNKVSYDVALSSGVEIIRDNYELETEKKKGKKRNFFEKKRKQNDEK